MKIPDKLNLTNGRIAGIVLILLGLTVLVMPFFVGEWVISLLGIVFIGVGLFQFVETVRSADPTTSYLAYLAGLISVLLGLILFISPKVLLAGILIGVMFFLLIDGVIKLVGAYKLPRGPNRRWTTINALFTVASGFAIWWFVSANLGLIAVGVVLGLKLIVEGWAMLFLPQRSGGMAEDESDPRLHPDRRLRLEPSDTVREFHEKIIKSDAVVTSGNIVWCLTLLGILFVIHFLRTDAKWSFIGLISPFTAVIGDAVVALLLGTIIVLPARLFWRWLTRPFERAAWNRFYFLRESGDDPTPGEKVLKFWIETRMRFALELRTFRQSIHYTLWRVLRFGLPLTAVLVAINSIWGFSWYFNSENWASGVFQEITKARVDVWRKRMAEDAEKLAVFNGVAPEKVFAINPEGVTDSEDFSFVVIGDTGEGDGSQMSLREQLIAASKREDVKFLVLSSDVIYPDGKMKDYENNFYMPFMGFQKPIYAIPGNHDWFDANEGFNANFLDLESAKLALRGRLAEDLNTEVVTTDQRFDEITAEAARLRDYYGIMNGLQRGPFFEMHRAGFSLITVDTGIVRSIDAKERAWLEAALKRAGNNFKMVVLGHPFYVNGRSTVEGDVDFGSTYEMLKRFKVDVAMAGDTHDFEFYKIGYAADGGDREMHHFVNGGGGAYLSIGTSVGFPKDPVTSEYAFYPRTDQVTAKIRSEAGSWRMPFFYWMQWLGGWPFDQEMVSGAFDFNRAPFFQSFMIVTVERAQSRVRLALIGAQGPLKWRDIQTSGSTVPPGAGENDNVEFVIPMKPQ